MFLISKTGDTIRLSTREVEEDCKLYFGHVEPEIPIRHVRGEVQEADGWTNLGARSALKTDTCEPSTCG